MRPLFLFKIFYSFILERGEGREEGRERNIDVRETYKWLPLAHTLTGGQTHNLVMP